MVALSPSPASTPTAAAAEDEKDLDAEAGADQGVALDSLLDLAKAALDASWLPVQIQQHQSYYGGEAIEAEDPDMVLLCCRCA
jgi:hypothetical protein